MPIEKVQEISIRSIENFEISENNFTNASKSFFNEIWSTDLLFQLFRILGTFMSITFFIWASYGAKILLIPAILLFIVILANTFVPREKKWRPY